MEESKLVLENYRGNASDKEWIIRKHALTIYNSLSSEQKVRMTIEKIEEKEKNKDATANENSKIILGKVDNVLCSFIWYEVTKSGFTGESIGYVLDLYVEEDYRKKGYAKELIYSMIEDLKNRDIKRIDLSVAEENDARYLYQSIGFKATMRRMSLSI